jgi:hypothetical protein
MAIGETEIPEGVNVFGPATVLIGLGIFGAIVGAIIGKFFGVQREQFPW